MSIEDARLPCCGLIPEKVYGQWEPHDPSEPCRPASPGGCCRVQRLEPVEPVGTGQIAATRGGG